MSNPATCLQTVKKRRTAPRYGANGSKSASGDTSEGCFLSVETVAPSEEDGFSEDVTGELSVEVPPLSEEDWSG